MMDGNEKGSTDDKYVLFKQDDLFSESFPLMREIRRQGKLCDVTLKVGGFSFIDCPGYFHCPDGCFQVEDHSFSAHRIVLSATIPYFYAMFTNNMAESRIKEITMKEIEPQ